MRKALFIAAVAGVLIPRVVLADEGFIPIYQPTTITQPGNYVLTRDVSSGGVPVIQIQASNVNLDLNGHTVSSAATTGIGTVNIVDGKTNVTIRNGRVTGGASSIRYFSSSVPTHVVVESVEIQPVVHGVEVDGAGQVDVISCHITGGTGHGIFLNNISIPGTSFGGRIVNNEITGVGDQGIFLMGLNAGEVRGNLIRDFGVGSSSAAISVGDGTNGNPHTGGNIVADNTIRGGGSDDIGIAVSAQLPNFVLHNVITQGGRVGIYLQTGGNIVSRGLGDGVQAQILIPGVGFRNLIEGNHIEGNAGCGIKFFDASSQAYRDNMLQGNTGGAVCGSANTDAGGNIL